MKNITEFITESAKLAMPTCVDVLGYLQSIKNDKAQSDWLVCDDSDLFAFVEFLADYFGMELDDVHEGFSKEPDVLDDLFRGVSALFMTRTKKFEAEYSVKPVCGWIDADGNSWNVYAVK